MEIRDMTEADLAAADELRRLAGWNQTLEDWRQLLSFEPQGCFVAVEAGRVIGTLTTTTYGRELAWIGMMLVHPDYRRQGIGTRLMRTALEYLRDIPCIRLDATPAGQPVYEKLGFVSEWTLTRHQAVVVSSTKVAGARELLENDWPAVEKLDAAAFGVARGGVLRSLAETSRATLVCPPDGPLLGYGMLRRGSSCDYLGPLVSAKPGRSFIAMVSTLLGKTEGRPVFWDVLCRNLLAASLARKIGFTPVRALTRMRLGPDTIKSDPRALWAIADPSLG